MNDPTNKLKISRSFMSNSVENLAGMKNILVGKCKCKIKVKSKCIDMMCKLSQLQLNMRVIFTVIKTTYTIVKIIPGLSGS